MLDDANQVKLRGTVAETYHMQTAKGHDRLTFTLQLQSEFTDTYGDKVYNKTFITCVAWAGAAKLFKDKLEQGTRVQLIGELTTYTSPNKKDPSIIMYKSEVRTHKIEIVGFDETFKPRSFSNEKVEFSITDDFSDLD